MKNKKSLYEIQIALQDAITNRATSEILAEIISEKPPIPVNRRLEIYQDAYEIRLVESLREDYPSVVEALKTEGKAFKGDEPFDAAAMGYLKEYPSKYYSLADVSQNFPEFLKTKSESLFEIATQDWLKVLSSYAPEPDSRTVISAETLSQEETFYLKKHPATYTASTDRHRYLSYRCHWDYYVYEISNQELDLIQFLKTARSLDEFTLKCFELNLNEIKMADLLSRWIKEQVIYCERNLP